MCHWVHTVAMKTSLWGWRQASEGEEASSKVAHQRKSLERSEEINNALSCAFSTLDGWLGHEFTCKRVSGELQNCKSLWSVRLTCFLTLSGLIRNLISDLCKASRQHERRVSWGEGQDHTLQEIVSSVHICDSGAFPRVECTRVECELSASVGHTFLNANAGLHNCCMSLKWYGQITFPSFWKFLTKESCEQLFLQKLDVCKGLPLPSVIHYLIVI